MPPRFHDQEAPEGSRHGELQPQARPRAGRFVQRGKAPEAFQSVLEEPDRLQIERDRTLDLKPRLEPFPGSRDPDLERLTGFGQRLHGLEEPQHQRE